MRCELPDCKRCCFCLPLRYGLLGWTYFKLIPLCLIIIIWIHHLCTLVMLQTSKKYDLSVVQITIWIGIILLLISDLVFSIIFLIGGHLKNAKILRLHFYYSIVILVINMVCVVIMISTVLWNIAFAYFFLFHQFNIMVACFAIMFINIFVQVYTIILTKSEIRKLENDCEVRFVNLAAESKCTMNIGQNLKLCDEIATDDATV